MVACFICSIDLWERECSFCLCSESQREPFKKRKRMNGKKRKRKTNNIMIQPMNRPPGFNATKQFTLPYTSWLQLWWTLHQHASQLRFVLMKTSTRHKLQMDIRLPHPPWTIHKGQDIMVCFHLFSASTTILLCVGYFMFTSSSHKQTDHLRSSLHRSDWKDFEP